MALVQLCELPRDLEQMKSLFEERCLQSFLITVRLNYLTSSVTLKLSVVFIKHRLKTF